MIKELNITFTYDDDDKNFSFEPISTEYPNVNHAILANCIAGIIYAENKKMNCFSSHILADIEEMIEENK